MEMARAARAARAAAARAAVATATARGARLRVAAEKVTEVVVRAAPGLVAVSLGVEVVASTEVVVARVAAARAAVARAAARAAAKVVAARAAAARAVARAVAEARKAAERVARRAAHSEGFDAPQSRRWSESTPVGLIVANVFAWLQTGRARALQQSCWTTPRGRVGTFPRAHEC